MTRRSKPDKASAVDALAWQLKHLAPWIPEPVRELQFHSTRKWRFDLSWPESSIKIAVEIEGGVWTAGRHVRGSGFLGDCEKYNTACGLFDWTLLRFTPTQATNGEALAFIEEVFKHRGTT